MKWNCVIVINVYQMENTEPIRRCITRCSLDHDRITHVAKTSRTESKQKKERKKNQLQWSLNRKITFEKQIVYPNIVSRVCSAHNDAKRKRLDWPMLIWSMVQEMIVEQHQETHYDHTAIWFWNNRIIIYLFRMCIRFTCDKFDPWYKMSCMAWILKLSSTFVNGVYNKWTIAIKKTRTPIWRLFN